MALLRRAAAFAGAGLLAAALAIAAPKKQEPAIWTIQKPNGTTVTFFGSVHLLPDGDAWRTKALIDAYEGADVIVLETDLAALGNSDVADYLERESLNAPGVTLSKLLSPEQKAIVAKGAEAAGLRLASLESYRPWYVALQISVSFAVSQGFNPDEGVDKRLESDGKADGKALAYFEKLREQLDVFIDLPEDEQIAFLVLGAQEVIDRPDELEKLVGAWAKGDVEEIDALMNRGMEGSPGLARALLADRNARWVKQIREFFMKDNNSYLIVVGAGHLAGDESVIEMLRDAGVEVQGP